MNLLDDHDELLADQGVYEPLLRISDVAARLQVPETWVRDKVTQRAVVHRRIGKHVRFTEADYAALLELARVSPEGGAESALESARAS